jgi:hypothetical protein
MLAATSIVRLESALTSANLPPKVPPISLDLVNITALVDPVARPSLAL